MAGGLALGSEALLSKVVSIVIFVVLLLAALLGALHMTPQQAVDKVKEYRSQPLGGRGRRGRCWRTSSLCPSGRQPSLPKKPVKDKPTRKRADFDIPLDGEPSAMEGGEKKDFFPRRSAAVRTPDQVLARKDAAPAAPEMPAAPRGTGACAG